MSRLYRAIRALAESGDRAAIGIVTAALGGGIYQVHLEDSDCTIPAVGEVQADVGDKVAVLIRMNRGREQPLALLGPV